MFVEATRVMLHPRCANCHPAGDSRSAGVRTVGLILAAGEGRRMGGPKALLLLDGAPLVRQHVARLREAGCRSVLVVASTEQAERVQASAPQARVIAATTASQAESLAFGVSALDPLTSVVVITPVDMKPVREATLRQLLGALTAGVDAVSPTCGAWGATRWSFGARRSRRTRPSGPPRRCTRS